MLTSQAALRRATLIDLWWPDRAAVANAALVLAIAAVTALSAQLQIPLWFTPVPITGQTFAFLLSGAACGRRLGALGQLTYVAAGALGAPIFAGASGGLHVLLGASGGYLIGGILCAYAVGALAERGWVRGAAGAAAAMALGELFIYLPGLAVLSRFVPAHALLLDGLWPFLPGDLLKALLAAACLPLAWRITDPSGRRREGMNP